MRYREGCFLAGCETDNAAFQNAIFRILHINPSIIFGKRDARLCRVLTQQSIRNVVDLSVIFLKICYQIPRYSFLKISFLWRMSIYMALLILSYDKGFLLIFSQGVWPRLLIFIDPENSKTEHNEACETGKEYICF